MFLGGNGLPARWAGRDRFVVVETGFGLGLNFLATLDAWKRDPRRPCRLDYVGIDRHPPAVDDLPAWLAPAAAEGFDVDALARAWPPLLPGTHRRAFAGGGVVLTLVFDDVEGALARLDARADAFYFDGFAPDRNPAMWSPGTMRALARMAAPGATFATWSTSRVLRDALDAAGFAWRKAPGFAPKREMLAGELGEAASRRARPAPARAHERRACIVGAGLAGASVARALDARGWTVTVVDAAADPPAGASSILAGTFHALVARDDSRMARLTRAGALAALDAWPRLDVPGAWSDCGVLQLAVRDGDEERFARALDALAFPPSFVRLVGRDEARDLAGAAVARGGLWFPRGGWARAPRLAAAQVARLGPGATRIAGRTAARLAHDGERWTVLDAAGAAIASAPVAILACGAAAAALAPALAVRALRGQATYLDAASATAPRAVVIGHGYALPAIDGVAIVGSSYDREDDRVEPTAAADGGNLARRGRLFDLPPDEVPRIVGAGVGFRAVTPDRMPLVGPVPGNAPGLWAAGGFGSRGLVWSALAGETLASMLDGDPLPLETDLAAAIDPRRFERRAARGA